MVSRLLHLFYFPLKLILLIVVGLGQIRIIFQKLSPNHNHDLQTSKAPLESQAQDTS